MLRSFLSNLSNFFPLKRIILGGIHLRFSEDVPLFVTAVTEELWSEVQSGILGLEHYQEFFHRTQHTETSGGVESRLFLGVGMLLYFIIFSNMASEKIMVSVIHAVTHMELILDWFKNISPAKSPYCLLYLILAVAIILSILESI